MSDDKKHIMRIGGAQVKVPRIGGALSEQQLSDIGTWTYVPPFDGLVMQFQETDAAGNVAGVVGDVHREMLVNFRGHVLSELITIEYLFAAIPLTDKLKNETDFHLKLWEKTNNNNVNTFGRKLVAFKKWLGKQNDGPSLQVTRERFATTSTYLSNARNAFAHYPVQGAFNGADNTLTPYIYWASTKRMLVFDDSECNKLTAFSNEVRNELQRLYRELYPSKA